ncbi:MAG TPA: glycosyltransferase family 2 protein [Oscillatoriaceae cyanobacterium]
MKISAIVPTQAREPYLRRLVTCFSAQTHRDAELLILDDSPAPSPYFVEARHGDARVRYFYMAPGLSLGEKRNWLIERATGEVIAHLDDDDYYAPAYLETMLAELEGHDFVKLSGWYCYQVRERFLAYMDSEPDAVDAAKAALLISTVEPIVVSPMDATMREVLANMRWGFGFSYVYRKEAWQAAKFPAMTFKEDIYFLAELLKQGCRLKCLRDRRGIVLHILHTTNTSRLIAQYAPPAFLLDELFGAAIAPFLQDAVEAS